MPTSTPLSAEMFWLAATVLMSAVLWMPVIINRIMEMNLMPALLNPEPDEHAETRWAVRADRAHKNAVENLVLFAPLALAIEITGTATALTAGACAVYFVARAAHYLIYTLGVGLLRTIAFAVGFGVQVVVALTVLGWI